MPQKLDFAVAQRLAAALVTIGHPFHPAAIDATAWDLVKWCAGYFGGSRPISPEEQAESLIEEARVEWESGWPEKGGTRKLHDLFERMYPSKALAPAPATFATLEDVRARGLLSPPCRHCADDATFCEYGGARGHKRMLDDVVALPPAERKPPKAPPAVPFSLDEVLARGEQLWRAEQARKREQLNQISDGTLDYGGVS